MHDFYTDIQHVANTVPVASGEFVRVPQEALDSSPLRLRNIPLDEVVFAHYYAVVRDEKTKILMLDTDTCAQEVPTSEWAVMSYPPVMRVAKDLGGTILDGFLVDYRRIAFQLQRDSWLEYGTDNSLFNEQQAVRGTVFPLGALFNIAGRVDYHGRPELQEAAASMMHRVDTYILSKIGSFAAYNYVLPGIDPEKRVKAPAAPRPKPTSADPITFQGPGLQSVEESGDENAQDT